MNFYLKFKFVLEPSLSIEDFVERFRIISGIPATPKPFEKVTSYVYKEKHPDILEVYRTRWITLFFCKKENDLKVVCYDICRYQLAGSLRRSIDNILALAESGTGSLEGTCVQTNDDLEYDRVMDFRPDYDSYVEYTVNVLNSKLRNLETDLGGEISFLKEKLVKAKEELKKVKKELKRNTNKKWEKRYNKLLVENMRYIQNLREGYEKLLDPES